MPIPRLADTWPVCSGSGNSNFRSLSPGIAGYTLVRISRLRVIRISVGPLLSRQFLARRDSTVEPIQRVWDSVPGSMGDHGSLPSLAHLPVAAFALEPELLLSAAPLFRRNRYVHARSKM